MAKLKEHAFIVSVHDKNGKPIPNAHLEVLIDNEPVAKATTIGDHTRPIRVKLSEDVTVVDLRAVVDGLSQRVTVDADVGTYVFAFPEVEVPLGALQVVREAMQAVPAVKYALGVAGIAAAAAIAASFYEGGAIEALLAVAAMLVPMILLVLFARLTTVATKMHAPVLFMTWGILLLVILSATLLVTSVFFDWPKPIQEVFRVGSK